MGSYRTLDRAEAIRMRTFLVLVEVGAPEPLLVKVRAPGFGRAQQKVEDYFGVSMTGILDVWDLDDIETLDPARGSEAFRKLRRRPGDDVAVRGHVRRRGK